MLDIVSHIGMYASCFLKELLRIPFRDDTLAGSLVFGKVGVPVMACSSSYGRLPSRILQINFHHCIVVQDIDLLADMNVRGTVIMSFPGVYTRSSARLPYAAA